MVEEREAIRQLIAQRAAELRRDLRGLRVWKLSDECCTACKRCEAVALVKLHEGTSGRLTLPQQVLQYIQRLSRKQNPFTGDYVDITFDRIYRDSHCKDEFWAVNEWDNEGQAHWHGGIYLNHPNDEGEGVAGCKEKDYTHAVVVSVSFGRGPFRCVENYIDIRLCPKAPHYWIWMQGLVLALTGGCDGLLRDGRPSSMPDHLAECAKFCMCWDDNSAEMPANAKGLWPMTVVGECPGLTQERKDNCWVQHFSLKKAEDEGGTGEGSVRNGAGCPP